MDLSSGSAAFVVGTACAAAVFAAYLHFKETYSFFSKQNIKGPKPWPLLGHLAHIMHSNRINLAVQWAKENGKIFGIYMGSSPRLVIADPEIVRDIAIKDFDSFPDHNADSFLNKYQLHQLFFMQSPHWKRVRAIMSPTFTSGKIKKMFYLLDKCADDLVECLGEQIGDAKSRCVNMKDIYNLYAMDGITSCCYSIKLERAGDANMAKVASRNDFVAAALGPFKVELHRIAAGAFLPKSFLRAIGFSNSSLSKFGPLMEKSRKLLATRRRSPTKFDDYLSLLLEAKLNNQLELDDNDKSENHHAGLTHESLIEDQKMLVKDSQTANHKDQTDCNSNEDGLTEIELLVGVSFFLMVGLETTGNLLTNATYALAFHQDVQERLYREIRQIAKFDEQRKVFTFEYDTVTRCAYLDAVISETLRMLAPVMMIDRKAARDYHIKKYDIHVKKGQVLMLSYGGIHHNEEYWPEPEKFDPERFMPGNKEKIVPGSYCPFGLGPRHCIGMRFSLTEAKLGLAKILLNYQFTPAPETTFPPALSSMSFLVKIDKPSVHAKPRDHFNQ